MKLLNQTERRKVDRLVGDATTKLCEALEVIVKAQERVVNGSVNITAEHKLRDAIKNANEAARHAAGD